MALTKDDLNEIKKLLDPIDNRVYSHEARMDRLEARMDRLEEMLQSVHDSQLRMELEWQPRINLALEAIANLLEHDKEQDRRISRLEHTAENHEPRIMALERKT